MVLILEEPAPRAGWRSWRVWLVGLSLTLCLGALVLFERTKVNRAIERLSPEARQVLFERARKALSEGCQGVAGTALSESCRSQAEALRRFPECDAACRDLTARFLPPPSR